MGNCSCKKLYICDEVTIITGRKRNDKKNSAYIDFDMYDIHV